MLALVVALNVTWLILATLFLIPKFQKLTYDGVIDFGFMAEGSSWTLALLNGVRDLGERYAVWALFAAVGLVGLFEWRVKGPNKTFIRLSALGALGVGLTVVSLLVGWSLALPTLQSAPVTSRMAVTFAKVQIDHLDNSILAMEQALMNKDLEAAKVPAARASQALFNLEKARPAVRGLWSRESLPEDELRARVKEAAGYMADIRLAIVNQDAVQMGTGLGKLRQAYAPLQEASKLAR
jgi:hypothetical protein